MTRHTVLRVVAKLVLPLILLFALYVQFHGDFGPGGGFQAGVVIGAAIILYALVFDLDSAQKALPPAALRIGICLGVLIYGGVGVATQILGGDFLDYNVLAHDPVHGQELGILLIELGVAITVGSVMIIIFYTFASRIRRLPVNDRQKR